MAAAPPPSSSSSSSSSSSFSSSLKTTSLTSITPSLPTRPYSHNYPSSTKLKTLLQTLFLSHMYRIARALHKAKELLLHLFKDIGFMGRNRKHKQQKLFFGSFRLYYNWCSSNSTAHASNLCYDYTAWNTTSHVMSKRFAYDDCSTAELSRYLQWLEEKGSATHEELRDSTNEIDRLADLFIADCHEKFRLEKQESYRRFQEMMARSV